MQIRKYSSWPITTSNIGVWINLKYIVNWSTHTNFIEVSSTCNIFSFRNFKKKNNKPQLTAWKHIHTFFLLTELTENVFYCVNKSLNLKTQKEISNYLNNWGKVNKWMEITILLTYYVRRATFRIWLVLDCRQTQEIGLHYKYDLLVQAVKSQSYRDPIYFIKINQTNIYNADITLFS